LDSRGRDCRHYATGGPASAVGADCRLEPVRGAGAGSGVRPQDLADDHRERSLGASAARKARARGIGGQAVHRASTVRLPEDPELLAKLDQRFFFVKICAMNFIRSSTGVVAFQGIAASVPHLTPPLS